jgi:hypothetical protein
MTAARATRGLIVAPTLALSATLTACSLQSGAPSPSAAPSATVNAMAATTHTIPPYRAGVGRFIATDSGQLNGPSYAATWRSASTNGYPHYVSELMLRAFAVQHARHYEFDSTGALVHYTELSSETLSRDSTRVPHTISRIELEFAGGEAVYRARTEAGTGRRIRQWEVDRVVARARVLRDSAIASAR